MDGIRLAFVCVIIPYRHMPMERENGISGKPPLRIAPRPAFPLKFQPISADRWIMTDDPIGLELMLNRFRKLMGELIRGELRRTTFEPWEVEILLDFQTCALEPRRRMEKLRGYQRAVERQLETGPGPPMKLSEYLQQKMTRRPEMP